MISNKFAVRQLSLLEKKAIPASIGAELDLDAIEIHKRPWTVFTPQNVSVVRGYRIFYPNDPGPSDNLLHLAHLVHEAVHIWQYVHLGVGMYHPQWVYDRRYRYDLKPGDRFLSFGWEQQAAIAEDCFRVHQGLGHRWARNRPSSDLLAQIIANCDQ